MDHINLSDARDRKIPVGNTPSVLDGATADCAFTLILSTARKLVFADRYARSAEFTEYKPSYILGTEVHHTTIGIVGMGAIGEQIAKRANAFDMKVLYHNRHRKPLAESRLNAVYVALDDLLAQSDFVVLAVPLTDSTRGLIRQRELGLMKSSAILINVARGAVVVTRAVRVFRAINRLY